MTTHDFKKIAINTIEDYHKKQVKFNKPDRPKYIATAQSYPNHIKHSKQKKNREIDSK